MPSLVACFVVTLSLIATLAHAVIAERRAIQLAVSPQIAFAPATLSIRVRVQPNEEDRWIAVTLDSADFYRSSEWTIEGDRVLYSWQQPSVPAGEYSISAMIGHGTTIRAADRQHVSIVGP